MDRGRDAVNGAKDCQDESMESRVVAVPEVLVVAARSVGWQQN